MQIKTKKVLIVAFVVFYIFSFYFNQFYYFFQQYFSVYAKEQQVNKNNLYLIFVDKKLYSQLQSDIRWYVTDYIQKRYTNTIAKVVVVPSDISSEDIVKYIQKQYFDNTKNVLKGIVLIGDIPLPIINYSGYLYPSVYPYVDLIDKKFIYNSKTKLFDYVGGDNKPELQHSIIKFDNIQDYKKFFSKLRKYNQNPEGFVSKKFFYEDFVALKSYFNKENQPYYVNSLVFAEDILNHHFTNLLLKLLKGDYLTDLLSNLAEIGDNIKQYQKESVKGLEEYKKYNPEYAKIYEEYFKKTQDFVNKWKVSGDKYLTGNTEPYFPTKVISQAIKNFVKPITALFSPSYIEKISKNIGETGRRYYTFSGENNVDFAIKKILVKDKLSQLNIQFFNKVLEKAVDKKIEESKYYMLYPVFTYYQEYARQQCKPRYLKAQYENFYFGKYAGDITNAADFTIYRGTYTNYTDISQIKKLNIAQKDLGSIGKSFGFMQRQVEANRGYNVLLTEPDANLFKNTRCSPGETLSQWAIRFWGGASPLNVDWKNSDYTKPKFKFYNFKYAWNPSWNKNIGGWLFDIGGSILTDKNISSAIDWKAYKPFSAVIKTKEGRYNLWSDEPVVENITYCRQTNKILMSYPEFFEKYGKEADEGEYYQVTVSYDGKSKSYVSKKDTCVCWLSTTDMFGNTSTYCGTEDYDKRQYYYYKLIDTRVKHTAPTLQQIKKLSDVTYERPIDDPKYITFLGVGGDTVKLIYPDLWKVPVYKKVGNKYVLKSINEISQSIKDYLRQVVKQYNQELKIQLTKRNSYYNQHKKAFDFLAQLDIQATPSRTYSLLPEDYLIKTLGEKNIDILAENLYYLNLGWSSRPVFSDFVKELEYLRKAFNINEKISYIEDHYFSSNSVKSNDVYKAQYPTVESEGYEAGLINSDGADNIGSAEDIPPQVSKIKKVIESNILDEWNIGDLNVIYENPALEREEKCGIPPSGAVPLFQWPTAFACWLQSLPDSFKVEITNNCSFTIGNGGYYYSLSDWAENVKPAQDIAISFDPNDRNLPSSELTEKYFRKNYNEFIKTHSPDKRDLYQEQVLKYVILTNLIDNILKDKLSNEEKEIYNQLKRDISFVIKPHNFVSVDDKKTKLYLYIKSQNTDLGVVDIKIGAIGPSCEGNGKIYLAGTDICRQDFNFNFLTTEEQNLPLEIETTKAGNNIIQVRICKDGVCSLKYLPFIVSPGKLAKIGILTLDDKIVDGGQMPIKVEGQDVYGNVINQLIVPYRISVDHGGLIVGANKVKSFEFTNFKDAYFILDLSQEKGLAGNEVVISVKPVLNKDNLPIGEKKVKIVKTNIKLSPSKIIFQLPDKFDKNLSGKVILQVDGGISVPVNIKSEKNLVKIYANIDGKLKEGNYFIAKNGRLEVVLKPSYKAGSDNIIFKIPGLPEKKLPVEIKPASPYKVSLIVDKKVLNPSEATKVIIQVKDRWNNIVNQDVPIKVGVDLGLSFISSANKEQQILVSNTAELFIKANGKYSNGYIWAYISNKPLDKQLPDYKVVSIRKINWPIGGVNVMYLSLFGDDWGNLWGYFSTNKKVVFDLLKNNKTLAITTSLINPGKVNQIRALVLPDGKIIKFNTKNLNILLKSGKIFYNIDGFLIDLGSASDYSLSTNFENGNQLIYIPAGVDSIIQSNEIDPVKKQIKINKVVVIDFTNGYMDPQIRFSYDGDGFNVFWNNKKIGKLYIHRTDDYIPTHYKLRQIDNYKLVKFSADLSYPLKSAIAVVDLDKKLIDNWEGIEGILQAQDPKVDVGFKVFPNISQWAAGQNVGKATLKDANEFVVNFGDMFLKPIDKNPEAGKTSFDGSKGDLIYFDENGGIKKVLVGDFNNDGLKDLLIAYKDGRIRLLKNYGVEGDPFADLGDLLFIKNGIKDIYMGDVDGNGYEDLIVWTNKDQLIYYKNNKGIFAIDGKLICLDIPSSPSLKDIKQLFVKDMDEDGKLDIVTNDINGDIKIFYGNTYISNLAFKCDKDWRRRLQQKLVRSYGLILKKDKVYDKSLIYRPGLKVPDPGRGIGSVMDTKGNFINTNLLVENSNGQLEDLTYDKVMDLYNKKVSQSLAYNQKYVAVPSSIGKPVYEDKKQDVWYYVVSGLLDSQDGFEVYKKFTKLDNPDKPLKKGDIVKVEVYIRNLSSNSRFLTYLDDLKGPWEVDITDNGQILGFDKGNLPGGYILNTDVDPYVFKLDNVSIKPGQILHFSRYVRYLGQSPVNIEVGKFVSKGVNLPQIKILPVDGCIKKYLVAVNNGKNRNRDYSFEKVDLQKDIQDYLDQKKNVAKNKIEGLEQKITKGDYKSILDDFGGIEDITDLEVAEGKNIGLEDLILNGMQVNVNLFESETMNNFANELEDFTKNLCKGFSLGGDDGTKCGLEPPFNVAFFAPGIYNIFGCPLAWDPGRSVFWFPGTKWESCKHNPCCIPIPMPNKTSISTKVDPPNQFKPDPCPGVYPSTFRFYVAPTLTLGVGFVFCFGTYKEGLSFPHPWGTIAGNCVVVAKKDVLCKDKEEDNKGGNCQNEKSLENWQYQLADFGICDKPILGEDIWTSPFNVVYKNPSLEYESWESDEWFNTDLGGFEIGGNVIKLQRNYIGDTLQTKEVLLKKGIPIDLKIEGGNLKGLVQCIIKKWLDNQIRYIINALTNMTIYVYLPDLSYLSKGWGDLKKKFDELEVAQKWKEDWEKVENALKDKETNDYTVKSVLLPKKEVYDRLSEAFSNPFKKIEKLFSDIPLVRIQTRTIVIKLPRLTEEEWEKMKADLLRWKEENKKIIKEWEKLVTSAAGKCEELKNHLEKQCIESYNKCIKNKADKDTCEEEKQQCMSDVDSCEGTYQKYLKIYTNIKQIENVINRDIEAIDAWQRFPLQLYAYLHITDNLLQSLLCVIDKFFASIVRWFHQNAVRFEKWVDFIVLMIAVIKTWQILIDFSVKWKRSCGKCRVDNYDFYDCTLSVFCIDLPILPIPPFKLPDIFIDLSHIDIGLKIVLPEFKFKPIRLPRIVLPNLPYPPKFNLNIKLPVPPLLPMPPQLPSLTFNIPTPEIKLPPLLPPAPQLPPILPPIKAVVDIAQWIGKIRCIIKNGIGLVAEWNTKTRVEQLTQRYSRVAPFDFIQLTVQRYPFPRYYDVRIDSYVNLKINFETVYENARAFANFINGFTNNIVDEINQSAMKVEDATSDYQLYFENFNIDMDFQSFNDLFYYKSLPATGDYYDSIKKKLIADLDFLKTKDKNHIKEIEKLQEIMKTSPMISLNKDGLEKVRQKAKSIIEEKREYYQNLAQEIKRGGWNALIKKLKDNQLVSTHKDEEVVLYTNIININPQIKQFIAKGPNPYKTYFALNKKLVDGLWKKINQKPYYAFGMTKQDRQASKIYLSNLKATLDKVIAQKYSYASAPDENKFLSLYNMADISQYIHGFYIKGDDGKHWNVIYDKNFADKVRKNKTYTKFDFNGDGQPELILWDEKSVYIKWSKQNRKVAGFNLASNHFTDFKVEVLKKPDYDFEVNKFKITSMNYDNIGLSWLNDGSTKIYFIKITPRIDWSYGEKGLILSFFPPDQIEEKYVVVMDKNLDPASVKIEYADLKGFVYDLQASGKIILKQFDINKDDQINIRLSLNPRKWRYARISKMKNISTPDMPLYQVNSPWSNQVVFGRSIWSDDVPPSDDVVLIRTKTGKIVSKGEDLYGYVNTHYRLKINWDDNGKIIKSWIADQEGNIVKEADGPALEIALYSQEPKKFVYNVGSVDQNGNISKKQVSVTIKVPNIQIQDIKVQDGYAQIIAKLSSSIDEGVIKFYRNRFGKRQLLTGKSVQGQTSQFAVIWSSEYITGGLFSFDGTIVFKDIDGSEVGKFSPDGQLILKSPYQYSVDISQGYPIILIYNSKTGKTLWNLFVKSEKLLDVKTVGDYDVLNLNNRLYGIFDGGKCVLDKSINQCVMFVTPEGLIYIPNAYRSDWDEVKYDVVDKKKVFILKSGKGQIEVYSR